ncbi:MAG: C-GCAxxG-C-C family protein [Eubacteriales bacterium]
MSQKGERAYQLFHQGYNCCQSVVGAFCEDLGLEFDTAMRLASSLGGGMGRLREVCGACSGMFLMAGLVTGTSYPGDSEERAVNYAQVQRLAAAFRQQHGTLICRELLGLDNTPESPVPSQRTAEYYQKRPCADLVRSAAEILEADLQSLSQK